MFIDFFFFVKGEEILRRRWGWGWGWGASLAKFYWELDGRVKVLEGVSSNKSISVCDLSLQRAYIFCKATKYCFIFISSVERWKQDRKGSRSILFRMQRRRRAEKEGKDRLFFAGKVRNLPSGRISNFITIQFFSYPNRSQHQQQRVL